MSLKLVIAATVILVVAAGGWYVMRQETTVTKPELPMPPASSPAPARNEDELARRRLESIGSIRDLEPVPIRPNKP